MQCRFVQITALDIGRNLRSTINGQGCQKDALSQGTETKDLRLCQSLGGVDDERCSMDLRGLIMSHSDHRIVRWVIRRLIQRHSSTMTE